MSFAIAIALGLSFALGVCIGRWDERDRWPHMTSRRRRVWMRERLDLNPALRRRGS